MDTFKCGHPKTEENSRQNGAKHVRCKTCHNEVNRSSAFTWLYGPGALDHRERQAKKQKGLCAICGNSHAQTLHQDHDHRCCAPVLVGSQFKGRSCGKCLRGLLCWGCNARISFVEETLRDNPELKISKKDKWLTRVAAYLKKWERK